MRPGVSWRAAQPGLTLLELLAGLVILGLLMVVLQNALELGLRTNRASDRLARGSEDLIATDRVLRQLITGLDPGTGRTPLHVVGSAEEFDFTSTLPLSAPPGTSRINARLFVDTRHRLVLRWLPHRHEHPFGSPGPEQEVEILDGVEKVSFAYRNTSIGQNGWQSSWTDPVVPSLVRVHLDFGAGSGRHWPDFVVAPLLESPGG